MTSPRRRLGVLQTLVGLDEETFATLVPHMNELLLENVYQCVANVLHYSRTRMSFELRAQLSNIVFKNIRHLQFLAGKKNSKLKKRRLLRRMACDVQVLLSVAVPLIILSHPAK